MKALNLFNKLKTDETQPNEMIYLYIIKALSKIGDYSLCELTLKDIPENYLQVSNIQTVLINMWVCTKMTCFVLSRLTMYLKGRCSAVHKAEEIYKKIKDPDQFAYSTMSMPIRLNV